MAIDQVSDYLGITILSIPRCLGPHTPVKLEPLQVGPTLAMFIDNALGYSKE